MFTGLIEEIGVVKHIARQGDGYLLEVSAKAVLDGTRIGDSISINGACQTVTELSGKSFTVFVSKVTASLTTLGDFTAGRRVNLERAMTPLSRFGGHIVQGHVDNRARIIDIVKDSQGIEVKLEASAELMHYIVAKGSVTVDGISLTVVTVSQNGFSLYLIPETLEKTIISDWKKGGHVNIEVDILIKYVEKMLASKSQKNGDVNDGKLLKALAEGGFLS